MTEPRRFPPPWTIEDNGACFIVKDHGGMALAYSRPVKAMRKNMRMSIVVFSFLLAAMAAQEASAAFKIKHFPPCPEGVIDKETCECRAFVSTRFHICQPGQYCLRNAFHGMCW